MIFQKCYCKFLIIIALKGLWYASLDQTGLQKIFITHILEFFSVTVMNPILLVLCLSSNIFFIEIQFPLTPLGASTDQQHHRKSSASRNLLVFTHFPKSFSGFSNPITESIILIFLPSLIHGITLLSVYEFAFQRFLINLTSWDNLLGICLILFSHTLKKIG